MNNDFAFSMFFAIIVFLLAITVTLIILETEKSHFDKKANEESIETRKIDNSENKKPEIPKAYTADLKSGVANIVQPGWSKDWFEHLNVEKTNKTITPVKKTKSKSKPIRRKTTTPSIRTTKIIEKSEIHVINGHTVAYNDELHYYFVDGIRVPSVSEIIKKHANKFNVYDDYKNVDPEILRLAALKGTRLHKEIEDYEINGNTYYSTEFNNYLRLKKRLNFEVLENEKIILLYNSNGKVVGAGRLDMVIKINEELAILDIKRTSRFYRDKVTAQINLYRIGYLQTYKSNISRLMCMQLRESVAQIFEINNDHLRAISVLDLL
jgi:hypothetical protein